MTRKDSSFPRRSPSKPGRDPANCLSQKCRYGEPGDGGLCLCVSNALVRHCMFILRQPLMVESEECGEIDLLSCNGHLLQNQVCVRVCISLRLCSALRRFFFAMPITLSEMNIVRASAVLSLFVCIEEKSCLHCCKNAQASLVDLNSRS